LPATLGSAANAKEPKWKYAFAPEIAVRQRIKDHVRALGKGPGGRWEVKDLGDLDELKDLPDSVRKMFPHTEGITTRIEIEDGNKTIHSSVERDGVTLEIEQEGEGEITVRRTQQDGSTSEQVFQDEEALKAGDAEAYDVYSGMADGTEIEIDLHGLDNLDLGNLPDFKRKFQFKLDGLDEGSEEVRDAIEEAHRAFRETMKDIPDQGFFHGFGGPRGHARWFDDGEEGEEGDGDILMHRFSAPRQTFKVMPDGSIELRSRHGETEVIEVYRNEDDLSARNPEMYEKFSEVHEAAP
jgi:hypothetical protein